MLTKIKVDNMGIFSAIGSVFGRRNKRQDNSGMNDLTSRVSALEAAGSTAGVPPPPQSPTLDPTDLGMPANMQGGRAQNFIPEIQQQVGQQMFGGQQLPQQY